MVGSQFLPPWLILLNFKLPSTLKQVSRACGALCTAQEQQQESYGTPCYRVIPIDSKIQSMLTDFTRVFLLLAVHRAVK
jgi:hypothetical protein